MFIIFILQNRIYRFKSMNWIKVYNFWNRPPSILFSFLISPQKIDKKKRTIFFFKSTERGPTILSIEASALKECCCKMSLILYIYTLYVYTFFQFSNKSIELDFSKLLLIFFFLENTANH